MQSLEGPPKDTAKLANKKGRGSLADILQVLDKAYSRSASYVHLQSELCNIQQLYKESAQDYFQQMVRLQVAIQDKYPTCLNDLELERTAQEAYFNGLREKYKPRIAYMLEKPDVTVTDLVEAVRHIEADTERWRIQHLDAVHYPSSTSMGYKPSYQQGPPKDNKDHRNKVNHDNRGVINAKPVQVRVNWRRKMALTQKRQSGRGLPMRMRCGARATTCARWPKPMRPTSSSTPATTAVKRGTSGMSVLNLSAPASKK